MSDFPTPHQVLISGYPRGCLLSRRAEEILQLRNDVAGFGGALGTLTGVELGLSGKLLNIG